MTDDAYPRLVDLFCKAGGATKGYQRAGFYVVGVDIEPQPRYCGDEFIQADVMELRSSFLRSFDAIHASPPCQAYSSATKAWHREADHPDLYDRTRAALRSVGVPWAIENVEGAPYHHGVTLCGSMFGLGVQRHRNFETSHLILSNLACCHSGRSLTVTGHSPYWWDQGRRTQASTGDINEAMGIDWMNRREIVEAIPPAYTEWIGAHLLACLVEAAS